MCAIIWNPFDIVENKPPWTIQLFKLFLLSVHVPLLKRGLLSHALNSATKVTVADKMYVLPRIFAGGKNLTPRTS